MFMLKKNQVKLFKQMSCTVYYLIYAFDPIFKIYSNS